MTLTPGGPIGALVFNSSARDQSEFEAIADRIGANDPLPVQYLRWLTGDDWMRRDTDGDGISDSCIILACDADGDGINESEGDRKGILRGDFGRSFFNRRSVASVLSERIVPTLELSITALIVAEVLGITIGVLSAVTHKGLFDNLSRIFAVVVNSVPNFWLGILLLFFLGFQLQIFPGAGGRCAVTLDDGCPPIWQRVDYLVLPVIVLSAGGVAGISRFMRATMLDVVNQDYIRTAKAKGLSNQRIWFNHALRNALIPVIVGLGPAITGLLGGAVITETVFSYPGIGRTVVQAFTQRDYPIVMAITIYASIATILGFLISDILLATVDPRVRF